MEWLNGIGAWAGDDGPYVFIIAALLRINWLLTAKFFEQQDILTEALKNTQRAIDHVEGSSRPDV